MWMNLICRIQTWWKLSESVFGPNMYPIYTTHVYFPFLFLLNCNTVMIVWIFAACPIPPQFLFLMLFPLLPPVKVSLMGSFSHLSQGCCMLYSSKSPLRQTVAIGLYKCKWFDLTWLCQAIGGINRKATLWSPSWLSATFCFELYLLCVAMLLLRLPHCVPSRCPFKATWRDPTSYSSPRPHGESLLFFRVCAQILSEI